MTSPREGLRLPARLGLLLTLGLVLVAASCGTDRSSGNERAAITVFAASSLTEAFTATGQAFESAHPGVSVTFNFAASSELATQINEGAPADVFAAADESHMATVIDAGTADESVDFVRNQLVIITEPGNPFRIATLTDLSNPDLTLVLCAEAVPCGKYANQVLEHADVSVEPASLEDKVKGVVSKVTLGEADAGIVYVSDAVAAGGAVAAVEIPDEANVIATYPIAVLNESGDPELAEAFVEFVRSDAGQQILRDAGFMEL